MPNDRDRGETEVFAPRYRQYMNWPTSGSHRRQWRADRIRPRHRAGHACERRARHRHDADVVEASRAADTAGAGGQSDLRASWNNARLSDAQRRRRCELVSASSFDVETTFI